MRVYARCWWSLWLPAAAVGSLAGLTLGAAGATLAAAIAWSAIGALLAVGRAPAVPGGRVRPATVLAAAAWAGGLGGTTHAVVSLLGPSAWILLMVAAATSPWTARRVAARAVMRPGVDVAVPDGVQLDDSALLPPGCDCGCRAPVSSAEAATLVTLLDDSELCRAWRASYHRLGRGGSPAEQVGVVAVRQAYLDAFEARHPEGFARWLSSAPRASAGPEAHVFPGATRGPR